MAEHRVTREDWLSATPALWIADPPATGDRMKLIGGRWLVVVEVQPEQPGRWTARLRADGENQAFTAWLYVNEDP